MAETGPAAGDGDSDGSGTGAAPRGHGRNGAVARERDLWPEVRLRFHQESSGPTMKELHDWLRRQVDDKLTEPNLAPGSAIGYMLRHWDRLTLFLRQAGAPLDNNVCERAPKEAILHRKNTLF